MTVQQLIEYLSTLPKGHRVLTTEADNKDYVEFSSDRNIVVLHFNKSIVIGTI